MIAAITSAASAQLQDMPLARTTSLSPAVAKAVNWSAAGYTADASIFTDEEEAEIASEVEKFADQCDIAVASGYGSGMSTAKQYYKEHIGSGKSGSSHGF